MCDQKEEASSRAKSTPPMGAPKAAARPEAAPALMNSRWSRSHSMVTKRREDDHVGGCSSSRLCPAL